MKLKYILIIIGSMLLLLGILILFTSDKYYRNSWGTYSPTDYSLPIIISIIGLGTLLTGIFWKKQ